MPDGAETAAARPSSETTGRQADAPAPHPDAPPLRLTEPLPGTGRAKEPDKTGQPPHEPRAAPGTTARPLGAPPARPQARHWGALAAFVLMVALPTAFSAAYLWTIAADRYGSKTAFSVRSNEATAPLEIFGTVTQLGNSSAALDGQILYDFIRSQQIVEQIGAELPLEAFWNRAPEDWAFSLGHDQPIEDVTEYWNDAIDVSLDPASGILTVEARAFRPEEAQAIAQAILEASAELVNRLTDAARNDAVDDARRELAGAEARLREIRARLRAFRDVEQDVDPSQNARIAIELVAGLEEELSQAQTQRNLLASALSPDSPRLQLLRRRIATLEERIAAERTRLGTGGTGGTARALSDVVGDFEELVVDREFGEQAYTLALSTFEQAQAEARRRQRYLTAHVSPTLSQEAQYPDRPLLTAAIFGVSLALWAVLMLIGWNIRDRR